MTEQWSTDPTQDEAGNARPSAEQMRRAPESPVGDDESGLATDAGGEPVGEGDDPR